MIYQLSPTKSSNEFTRTNIFYEGHFVGQHGLDSTWKSMLGVLKREGYVSIV
jgi:hypothetical protein